jgi:hypothetical protein
MHQFSPFVSLVALRLQEFVQRICHVWRNNSVAFSMTAATGTIVSSNFVPNAGKAAASSFRNWDEGLTK